MTVSVSITQLEVSAVLVKLSAANMWVTIFIELCMWESLLQSCRWYFLQWIMHMTVSIVTMQVTLLYSYVGDSFK